MIAHSDMHATTTPHRRRIADEWIRGRTVAVIARRLRVLEAEVRADLEAVLASWTTTYGSPEIGLALERYQAVARLSATLAAAAATPAAARCHAARLAAAAQAAQLSLLDRAGVRHPTERASRVPTGDAIRRFLAAVDHWKASAHARASVPEPLTDQQLAIGRLLAQGRSSSWIAHCHQLAHSAVEAEITRIHADWVAHFGSLAAGSAFVLADTTAAQMLVAAERPHLRPRERCQFLREVVTACTRAVILLDRAGLLTRVREQSSDFMGMTPEEAVAMLDKIREDTLNFDHPCLHVPERSRHLLIPDEEEERLYQEDIAAERLPDEDLDPE